MPRLKLNAKRPKLKTKSIIKKGMTISRTVTSDTPIVHDDSDLAYLSFFDPMIMKISRVDRYSIQLYIKTRVNDEPKWDRIYDLLFYPSGPGMEQIEGFATDETFVATTGLANQLTHRLNQLKEYGNPHWHIDVDYQITFDNWRNLFKKSEYSTVVDAVPKRMPLKTKTIKRVKLKPKKRMKLKVASK